MGGLARFLCLTWGGSRRRDDWARERQGYAEPYGTSGCNSKVLEIIEEDLDHRLDGTRVSLQNIGSAPLRRVQKAGLPPRDAHVCKELLGKIAALDHVRQAADEERAQLAQALKAAEKSHRQAEFSRAKAEALATARGEALMHAQQATREAQREQAQLSEMLKQALQQLGMAATPNRSLVGTPDGSLITFDQSPSPMGRQEEQQQQQRYPVDSSHWADQHHAAQGAAAADVVASLQQQQGQQAPARGSLARSAEGSRGASVELSREFSGFTVYTNKLHDSTDLEGAAAAQSRQASQQGAACGDAEAEVRRSGVAWRDISSAVEASLSMDFGPSTGRASVGGSVTQLPPGAAAAADRDAQQQRQAAATVEQRQQQIQRMAQLVLPTLDASQLDSLVRIGASLPSPDMLMSPEVLSRLLPKVWDSSANPLQSAAGAGASAANLDAQQLQLLEQLNSQWGEEEAQQQVAGGQEAAGQQPGRPGEAAVRDSASGRVAPRGKVPRAGTWLSPLKIGRDRVAGEPTPSPQSHIKAVFRDDHDIQFYLPFSAGLQKPHTAARDEYKTRAAQAKAAAPAAAAAGPPAPSALPSTSPPRPRQQGKKGPGAAPPGAAATATADPGHQHAQHAHRPSLSQAAQQLSSWDLAAQAARQQWEGGENSLQGSLQSGGSAELRLGAAAGSRAGPLLGGGGAREGSAPPGAAQPGVRKQAFLTRFQPMGSHAALQPGSHLGEAAGARPPSVNENLQEGTAAAAAGLRRQPSGKAWQQGRQHKTAAEPAKRASGTYGGHAAAGTGSGTAALADSTNAGPSYLQRLAQQRMQQAYGTSSQLL